MRYEDASQISTDVTARDDTEHLAGNDFGPATGNLITGAGTVSGATGTDSGGSITAIVGAGGSDDSFDSNGMLEVAGQYGTLTIDAQGNYTYVRTPGSPEGVSDTFTYTLANEAGATDTAQLVIAIGDLPILQAQGTQTILQNGNVVVLPPGVELSDVRVVGRDLVITLPDGSTMVIPDGAVFVPQLVVNGVEVPASNLAALLIDAEPRPAAGDGAAAQQSSGGNFGLPPGPLDPGVPLGDLLPPTELDYTPPEVDELFDAFDNDPPVISPSSVNVSDEGVSTVDVPIPDNSGSPDTTNERIVNGHINVVDPDGDSVTITLGEPTNALTSQGDPIDWSVSPDGHTVIGTAGGIEVIRIVIQDNGDYTVTQSRPIDHPNTSIEDGVSFVIPVFATDGEDFAVPGTITVTIEDDSPVVENVTVRGGITLDESDADPRTPEGFPISGSTDGPIIVNDDGGFGADGEAAGGAIVYGLGLTGGVTSLASGIQTAIGNHAITLVQVSATLIEGQYEGSVTPAFTIEMNPDGSVTLTQNVPLEHLVDGPPGPDHDDSLDLDGLVNATVTYTDFDGDSDTGSAPIGGNLIFKDDGPNAEANEQASPDTVILDETRDEGTDTDDGDPVASPPPGLASDTIDFSDNFFDPDFGADGEGTVAYQLLLSGENVGSGLYALDPSDTVVDGDGYGQGEEIVLNISDDGLTITGSAGEVDYFTITIDPDTGVVTFAQQNPIWHPVIGDFDDQVTLTTELASDIQVQQTVTDSDGDFDTATVDIGQEVFSIQDDGPEPYDPCPEEVISVNDPDAEPFTGSLNLPDVGEDEPGAVTFGVQDGDPVLDTGGQPVTSGDDPLFYFINDEGVLEARVGDENGELIFTITLNGDGTFTYDQIGTIGSGGQIVFSNVASSAAGNVLYRGIGEDDADTPVDILLSGSDGGGADDGVNTDADSIGVDNQSVDLGETVRLDFVSNLETPGVAPGTPTGFSYDAHVDTNTYIQTISQVQGTQTNEVAFQVWALDTSDTQANEPDRNPAGGFANSTITAITSVTVIGFDVGEGTPISLDISGIAAGVWTDVGYGISVQKQADGSVIFTGVQEGDQYGIGTGGNTFNAVAVQSEPIGTGPLLNESNQDSFDLGVFAIGSESDFEPVDLQVPIVLTDADGDAVECEIDIHIGEPLVVSDATVTVNEAGLPIGSDPLSDSEIQSGTLTPSGGTGPYTFTLLSDPNGVYGNLILDQDTGDFTYTLDTPFDSQPDADDGTNPELGAESFDVLIEDSTGATHTATITVNIIDDVPSAEDDVDSIEGGAGPATGNVMTSDDIVGGDANLTDGVADVEGADSAQITLIESVNVPANSDDAPDGSGDFVVVGQYGTLTINEDGNYSYTRTDLEAGGVDDVFTYTLTDGDGDTVTATLTISIADNFPEAGNVNVQLDDDALAGGNLGGTDDVDPDTANLTGNLPGSGGDGTHTFSVLLTGAPAGFSYVSGGAGILLIQQGGETKITVTVNEDGTYEVEQNNPIDHPTPGESEENIQFTVNYRVTDGDGDFDDGTISIDVDDDTPTIARNEESVPSLVTDDTDTPNATDGPVSFAGLFDGSFGADGEADTDALTYSLSINGGDGTASGLFDVISGDSILLRVDGDTIEGYLEGTPATVAFTITLDPDTGDISLEQDRAITHDDPLDPVEDGGDAEGMAADLIVLTATIEDHDGDTDSATADIGDAFSFEDDGPSITRNEETVPTLVTDDTDTPDDTAGPVSFAALFDSAFGKDGPKDADDNDVADDDAIAFSLSITGGNGTDSGLNDVISGDDILLRVVGDTIEGYLENATTTVAFTITLDPDTGEISLEQDRAITHDNADDPIETGGEAETMAAGLIVLTATITDGDGDTDTATANIGDAFHFEDDGPSIVADETEVAHVDEDELPAGITDSDGQNTVATGSLAALVDYGADGPGGFSFDATALGDLPTDLTSGGDPVNFAVVGDVLVAYTGADETDDTSWVFTVEFTDAEAGDYEINLLKQIDHVGSAGLSGSGDDQILTIDLSPVVIASDGDGDSVTLDAGSFTLEIEDDIPVTYEPANASLTNGPGAAIHFDLDDIGQGGNDDIGDNFGADGPGVVRFPSSLDESDSGETSGGVTIWYFLNGDQTVLEARTGATVEAAATGTLIFTVTLDQANDRYTIDMDGKVDAFEEVTFDDVNFDFVGGNGAWFGIVPNDQGPGDTPVDDDSQDVLITPTNETSVNTSGILGGIDTGQSVGPGEGFRLDYVIDLTGAPANTDYVDGATNGHVLNAGDTEDHWTTNGAFFVVRQTDGSDVLIKAFDDTTNDDIVGGGTQEAITRIVIKYADDDGQIHTSGDLIPTTTEQFVTLDDGGPDEITFSYQLDADNMSVIVTNLQGATGANEIPSTTISVFTDEGGGYNSLEVYHHGGETFKFAGFGAVTESEDPVLISLPTEIVDGDGDVVAGGDIDITLNPAGAETLLASTSLQSQEAFDSGETSSLSLLSTSSTQQLEKTAANSNNVVLAAALGAAGFAATGAAAQTPHFDVGGDFATNALVGKQAFADFGGTEIGGGDFADLSSFIESGGFEFGAMAMASTSHQAMAASHIGELTTSLSLGSGPNALLEGTDFGDMLQMPAPAMGMDVAMVSADALMPQVAGVNAQTTGAVEQILADALQGGGSAPDIDALLNALPGGANVGLQNLATQAGDHVPTWDMGHGGVFTFDVASIITMQATMLHHDAVQPVANG